MLQKVQNDLHSTIQLASWLRSLVHALQHYDREVIVIGIILNIYRMIYCDSIVTISVRCGTQLTIIRDKRSSSFIFIVRSNTLYLTKKY